MAATPTNLSESYASIAGLSKYNFAYNSATVDKIRTDIERRAVPLR